MHFLAVEVKLLLKSDDVEIQRVIRKEMWLNTSDAWKGEGFELKEVQC
jgi:hypothetical protein